MTDSAAFDLEEHPGRARLATRAAAIAVSVLLVSGLVAAAVHDDAEKASSVATAGLDDTVFEEEPEEVVVDTPTTVTIPPVTVPKVTVPPLPRLPQVKVPAVTVPPLTVPTLPSIPTCPATPPPWTPPPELGTYEIATTGGAGRLVKAWAEHTFVQDHAFSPDGTRMAYVLGRTDNDGQTPWELHIADAAMGNQRHLPTGTHGPSGLRWSPDGRHIAFVAQPAAGVHHSVFVLDTTTGESRQVSDAKSNGISFAEWSPDGTRLAWGGGWTNDTVTGVWAATIGDSIEVTKLTDDDGLNVEWSPDGRRIAYARYSGGTYLMDSNGSNRRLLHAEAMGAAWSPTDVRRLVLNVKGALYRVDPDTGVATFLAGGSAHGWLGDGSRLVTSSGGGTGLTDWNGCTQHLFTGDMVALTTWSPDSTRLILFRTWPYQSR